MEFECLVHIANKREHCESSKNKQFQLAPNSGLASSKALFLSAKQHIPLFTHCVPPHPGSRPTEQTGPEFLFMEGEGRCICLLLPNYVPTRTLNFYFPTI